ncbi:MAG: RNA polymerase factor sigma-54 [Deltaproteobacteria bacterium]|nr:RNA polymerase factor sigma-54 [Deltaproteobacteria bacterium]
MDMKMQLQVKLSQQLVMTPQLVQAIRLLQLSRLELVDEVRKELDGNPVLADDTVDPKEHDSRSEAPETGEEGPAPEPDEVSEAAAEPAFAEEAAAAAEAAGAGAGATGDFDGGPDADGAGPELDGAAAPEGIKELIKDLDWDRYLENQHMHQSLGVGRGGYEELPPIEQSFTRPPTLREHLLWQLRMSDFTDAELAFALLVIGNLDDKGHLDLSLDAEGPDGQPVPDLTIEDLAREAGLDPEDAEEVLGLIQRFDPLGVAARSLRECLLVQADVLGYDAIEKAIIRDHLHEVERRNLGAIAKALNISLEDVVDAVQEIQKLQSVPARNFTDVDDRTIGITPDVFVFKDGERFVVTDNDRGMQRLYVNEALVKRMLKDPKAKEFINEKLRSAQWLIRAIEQRRRTIIRVTECIVDKQREFLEKGVAYLKPMILRDVAEAVSMHESTISRVTSNKYVHTPQGLFELKYFFNSSIQRIGDEDIASESVKQAIKKIVAEEDKNRPLSDQALVRLLQEQHGIRIARRTVAKYREMLGILSSAMRKNLF